MSPFSKKKVYGGEISGHHTLTKGSVQLIGGDHDPCIDEGTTTAGISQVPEDINQ